MKPPVNPPIHPHHLDGVTLEAMLTALITAIGWEAMAAAVPIRCFSHDPSIASSLKFLRRTPWARQKVEALYLSSAMEDNHKADKTGKAGPPEDE
jgi:uncharacterized protein (DUF2132 family)